ncbi:hypothetical protein AGLY_003432 [Aphis glycines]|uniref:Uncharacterized protein n=1 Tax=Aphis glycines TaxID=307491 RepID=A0A6G0TZN7_APHGL|nr:hypothetical protein AGLY_003432 [Aphis glycines]
MLTYVQSCVLSSVFSYLTIDDGSLVPMIKHKEEGNHFLAHFLCHDILIFLFRLNYSLTVDVKMTKLSKHRPPGSSVKVLCFVEVYLNIVGIKCIKKTKFSITKCMINGRYTIGFGITNFIRFNHKYGYNNIWVDVTEFHHNNVLYQWSMLQQINFLISSTLSIVTIQFKRFETLLKPRNFSWKLDGIKLYSVILYYNRKKKQVTNE